MSYKIGQYRYSSVENTYLTDVENVELATIETQGNYGVFSDIGIIMKSDGNTAGVTEGFQKDKSYYLNMSIPKDMNYDIELKLKLVSADDSNVFQNIETIKVPKGGTGISSYPVVLYRSLDSTEENEIIKAMVPIECEHTVNPDGTDNITAPGSIVYDSVYFYIENNIRKYYIGDENGILKSLDDLGSPSPYNDLFVTASWKQVYDENNYPKAILDFIFTPLREGLNKIVLEMTRTSDDYNIQYTADDGVTMYGRVLPIDKMSFTLKEVKNIIPSLKIGTNQLSKISVQSHPGLLMCINGEQIKVGPSRLYELETIPIKSLGFVAQGYEDNFILDYKYENISVN